MLTIKSFAGGNPFGKSPFLAFSKWKWECLVLILSFYHLPIWGIHQLEVAKNCQKEIFYCEKHLSEIERFYREEGEWSGVFTMSPIRFVPVGKNICHVLYQYTPTIGSYRTDTGNDYRSFYFEQNPKTCEWKVKYMGTYQSGYLAK